MLSIFHNRERKFILKRNLWVWVEDWFTHQKNLPMFQWCPRIYESASLSVLLTMQILVTTAWKTQKCPNMMRRMSKQTRSDKLVMQFQSSILTRVFGNGSVLRHLLSFSSVSFHAFKLPLLSDLPFNLNWRCHTLSLRFSFGVCLFPFRFAHPRCPEAI